MAERRPLTEGLRAFASERAMEEKFVYGKKPAKSAGPAGEGEGVAPDVPAAVTVPQEPPKALSLGSVSRVPLTTRVRAELATALKRASLERQLQGVEPNAVQDILEAALEPWLRDNGYLR